MHEDSSYDIGRRGGKFFQLCSCKIFLTTNEVRVLHSKTDLKTKKSSDLSSDSADPAFISPEKKQGHIPPVPVPHPSATCRYRVEMSFKPPTWLSFMHTTSSKLVPRAFLLNPLLREKPWGRGCTSSPSFFPETMERIACSRRSVGGERVKLYAASTKGKRG